MALPFINFYTNHVLNLFLLLLIDRFFGLLLPSFGVDRQLISLVVTLVVNSQSFCSWLKFHKILWTIGWLLSLNYSLLVPMLDKNLSTCKSVYNKYIYIYIYIEKKEEEYGIKFSYKISCSLKVQYYSISFYWKWILSNSPFDYIFFLCLYICKISRKL